MGTYTRPNLTDNALATQNAGVRHMPTQFASGGKSLTPLQRAGIVSGASMPVMPAGSARAIGGHGGAPVTRIRNPPIVAYASSRGVSHTRYITHMV